MADALYSARIELPANVSDSEINIISQTFGGFETSFSALRQGNHLGPWVLEWLFESEPSLSYLNTHFEKQTTGLPLSKNINWIILPIADQDWLAVSYEQFKPFNVGPFFIYGSHYNGQIPEEKIGLQIDAATAFGSGEHGTTKGCLQAMLDLKGQGACPWNVLDMGTGSGILAIAAWKLWKTPILAVDNDPEAVRVARVHQKLNHVPEGATEMLCVCGDGFAEPTTQKRKPYDLVIANILASALKEMAENLNAVTDQNGYVILSGILSSQSQSVLNRYVSLGFTLKKSYVIGDWTTLVLQRG